MEKCSQGSFWNHLEVELEVTWALEEMFTYRILNICTCARGNILTAIWDAAYRDSMEQPLVWLIGEPLHGQLTFKWEWRSRPVLRCNAILTKTKISWKIASFAPLSHIFLCLTYFIFLLYLSLLIRYMQLTPFSSSFQLLSAFTNFEVFPFFFFHHSTIFEIAFLLHCSHVTIPVELFIY